MWRCIVHWLALHILEELQQSFTPSTLNLRWVCSSINLHLISQMTKNTYNSWQFWVDIILRLKQSTPLGGGGGCYIAKTGYKETVHTYKEEFILNIRQDTRQLIPCFWNVKSVCTNLRAGTVQIMCKPCCNRFYDGNSKKTFFIHNLRRS